MFSRIKTAPTTSKKAVRRLAGTHLASDGDEPGELSPVRSTCIARGRRGLVRSERRLALHAPGCAGKIVSAATHVRDRALAVRNRQAQLVDGLFHWCHLDSLRAPLSGFTDIRRPPPKLHNHRPFTGPSNGGNPFSGTGCVVATPGACRCDRAVNSG